MKFAFAAAVFLFAAGIAYAASPSKYRCHELTHASDGARCVFRQLEQKTEEGATVPLPRIFILISAEPKTPLRERAEVRLQEILQQVNAELREHRGAVVPTVYVRANAGGGQYRDRACPPRIKNTRGGSVGGCEPWGPTHPKADRLFPPTTD